ncbi:uncharacterized protein LOC115281699 [Suricata suricatta]|uniref:uncharacterized protein LOC115281699 n=1 Tax=Suricata suricatta TaxID=37032 RepID=UPI001155F273|nr:uncharacterized protein LOC115281699 [Suricata suricatta]
MALSAGLPGDPRAVTSLWGWSRGERRLVTLPALPPGGSERTGLRHNSGDRAGRLPSRTPPPPVLSPCPPAPPHTVFPETCELCSVQPGLQASAARPSPLAPPAVASLRAERPPLSSSEAPSIASRQNTTSRRKMERGGGAAAAGRMRSLPPPRRRGSEVTGRRVRARYKQSLDPTVDEVKKLCTSLRRNAKEERVLFHYNGHGVPRPTVNGEIWVFNKNYTQYIPLSIYDLQTWMGSPSIFVYDCSNAGLIVKSFKQFALQREQELEVAAINPNHPLAQMPLPPSMKNCIQLAACEANELLPMIPDLPADLFTSCLTTPIKIALRW